MPGGSQGGHRGSLSLRALFIAGGPVIPPQRVVTGRSGLRVPNTSCPARNPVARCAAAPGPDRRHANYLLLPWPPLPRSGHCVPVTPASHASPNGNVVVMPHRRVAPREVTFGRSSCSNSAFQGLPYRVEGTVRVSYSLRSNFVQKKKKISVMPLCEVR